MSDTTTPQTPAAEPTTLPITPAPVADPPPAAAGEKPVYTGLIGDIKDVQSLTEYTQSLEKKLTEKTLAEQTRAGMPGNQPMTPPAPATSKSIEDEIEEEIFSNPKGAIQKLTSHILGTIGQENQKVSLKNQFWNDFWNENPDLKGLEKIVQSVEREYATELAPLTFSEARKKLAAETRKTIDLVKSKTGVRETEIPGGSATITGSSTSSVSGGGPTAPKVLSFVDQIRGMQRSRGK